MVLVVQLIGLRRTVAVLALLVSAALGAPASAAPSLEAYGRLPVFETAAISRSGRSIAIVALNEGVRKLMMFDENLDRTRAMAVDDLKIVSLEWIGDDAVLLVTSQTEELGRHFTTDRAEMRRALVVPASQGEDITVVFATQSTILGAVFGKYGIRQVDGTWTAYLGGVRMARRDDTQTVYLEHTRPSLIAVDLARDRTRMVEREAREGSWRSWLVDGRGEVAATLDIRTQTGDWVIAGPRGDRLASGNHPRGAVNLMGIAPAGDTIVYSGEDETSYSALFEVPLDASSPPRPFLEDEPATALYLDRTDSRIIGFVRRSTTDEQVFFDPARQDLVGKINRAFRGRTVRLADWTPDFSRLLVQTSGNGDSGTWYLIASERLEATYIGSERPEIEAENVGPISTFAYAAQDGLDLDGILTLPPGREPRNLPVVVMPHGGPASHDTQEFDWWAQAFASRGYAVFQPNFRGSTNRDQDFQRAGWGEWGRKMQSDVSDGLAALADAGVVDPNRACIVGASYGGYAALAGVTVQQGLYRCAVSVAGVSDLDLFFRAERTAANSNPMVKVSLLAELGPRSGFDAVSPRRLAQRADAPVLLIHGRNDTVVPFEQSSRMADALKDAGKPFDFVELREEDHWLSRSATRLQMLESAVAFVQKHNPAD